MLKSKLLLVAASALVCVVSSTYSHIDVAVDIGPTDVEAREPTLCADGYPGCGERATIKLFLMSKCPDCAHFIKWFQDLVDDARIKTWFRVELGYVAREDKSSKYGFRSSHGEDEVAGDLIEICLPQYLPSAPDTGNWFDVIACMDAHYADIPHNAKNCLKDAGVDENTVELIYQCAFGQEGHDLMLDTVHEMDELSVGWAPTIYIGEKGNRRSLCRWPMCDMTRDDYIKAICAEFKNPPPGCHP